MGFLFFCVSASNDVSHEPSVIAPDDVIATEDRATTKVLVWTHTPAMNLVRYSLKRHSKLSRCYVRLVSHSLGLRAFRDWGYGLTNSS